MSLLDSVRQTIEGAAATALEAGQSLGGQAQTQLTIKKLQIEHAKKLHQLGIRTYQWHKSGGMQPAGAVPREVQELCHALDDLNVQLEAEQRKAEAARLEAAERSARNSGAHGTGSGTTAAAGAATPTAAVAPTGGSTSPSGGSPSSHSPIAMPPLNDTPQSPGDTNANR